MSTYTTHYSFTEMRLTLASGAETPKMLFFNELARAYGLDYDPSMRCDKVAKRVAEWLDRDDTKRFLQGVALKQSGRSHLGGTLINLNLTLVGTADELIAVAEAAASFYRGAFKLNPSFDARTIFINHDGAALVTVRGG